ncbi:phage tail tube assembly chaperone [Limosilactobacillus reuteri]|uniref:phage tail tube assembly chaperone n=1 Tax=Limosilactobacillus reuteri TaxID=1598 RepID=UPI00081BE53A|nr:phage tail tube assembly chaperone [Limosilactobacillus reuteri]MCH5379829.1 hypothetical protein [Limosilactobacillus reuteri]OCW63656.1 hypothetical protein BBP12_06145 [Limosilactobacillus reuteri]OCW65692.1 hypothetical protein BBP11_05030 [Limosilactobacillus reuteri]OCW66035.1 hypothetical protein BBP10_02610 [Limosilactobacillus reuteri]OCW68864.1 hypothetical protein BBP14_06325 [Limosilactobacillus reuteri]
MQIYIKPLKKKINVPTSHKNMRRVLVMQKQFASMNNLNGKTAEEVFDTQIKVMDEADAFLKVVLKLKEKEIDRLDNMVNQNGHDVTVEVVDYVCQRLMGQSDKQIAEANKKVREDPKK